MAAVTKAGTGGYSPATAAPPASCRLGPFYAGEDLDAGTPCYIKNDGKVWKSSGAAANAAAAVHGWTVEPVKAGRQPVSLYFDIDIEYGSGLTPGAPLYLGATAGTLDTAPTTGGLAPIALVHADGKVIRILQDIK